jgi:arsenate reductase
MLTVYGIPNCDTVKKARTWLDAHGIAYTFHDYKKQGVDPAFLKRCCQQFGYGSVVNQRGTTWRKLSDAERSNLTEAKAMQLMLAQPSLIKRPIVDQRGTLLLGFDETAFARLC